MNSINTARAPILRRFTSRATRYNPLTTSAINVMAPHSVLQASDSLVDSTSGRALGNFSAGPACLADDVMRQAQAEFVNFNNSGMSIMEMSHRDAGGPVQNIIQGASDKIRLMLDVPDNYHVIFMQGGAHGQFASIALNLLGNKKSADYVSTGFWSERAIGEASKYCDARLAYDGKQEAYSRIPPVSEWDISPDSAYVHICANETIHGLEFHEDPVLPAGSPPLVGDFTSTLLSRPIDVSKYGCIYASGGKNLGPAGVTVIIIRNDLVGMESPLCPSVLSYSKMVNSKPIASIYNTPPTFLIYMVNLVLTHNMSHGGIRALQKRAINRADALYKLMADSEGFYVPKCNDLPHRSRMNIPFRIGSAAGDTALEDQFTTSAEKAGLLQLFCHPLFPGNRITLYNGIPDTAVTALIDFMVKFARDYRS